MSEYEGANGKRRYTSGKCKADVRTKPRKVLADKDAGVSYDAGNMTVGVFLDQWLQSMEGTVRERTWGRAIANWYTPHVPRILLYSVLQSSWIARR